jgi:NAD(P) transhydrogenase subunit alpha
LIFIFVLATFLGFELITKVPPTLHTPLMSGPTRSRASRSSGADLRARHGLPGTTAVGRWICLLALIFATINVVGGFLVTDRMLAMFAAKKKKS